MFFPNVSGPVTMHIVPRHNIILLFVYIGFKNEGWTSGNSSSPDFGNIAWQHERWTSWLFDQNQSAQRYFSELSMGSTTLSRIHFTRLCLGEVNLENVWQYYFMDPGQPSESWKPKDILFREIIEALRQRITFYSRIVFRNLAEGNISFYDNIYDPILVCICRSLPQTGNSEKFSQAYYYPREEIVDDFDVPFPGLPLIILPEKWPLADWQDNEWGTPDKRLISELFCHELGHHFRWDDQRIINATQTGDYDIMCQDTNLPFTTLFNRRKAHWLPLSRIDAVTIDSRDNDILLSPIECVTPRLGEKSGLTLSESADSIFCVEYRQYQNGWLGDRQIPSDQACVLITHARQDNTDHCTYITRYNAILRGSSDIGRTFNLGLFKIAVSQIDVNYQDANSWPKGQAKISYSIIPDQAAVTLAAFQEGTGAMSPDLDIQNARGSIKNDWRGQLWEKEENRLSTMVHNVGTGATKRVGIDWHWVDLRSNLLNIERRLIGRSSCDVPKKGIAESAIDFVPPYSGPIGIAAAVVANESRYYIAGTSQANVFIMPLRVPLDDVEGRVRQKLFMKSSDSRVDFLKMVVRNASPWFDIKLNSKWIKCDAKKPIGLEIEIGYTESPVDKMGRLREHELDFRTHLRLEIFARINNDVEMTNRLLRVIDAPTIAGYSTKFGRRTMEKNRIKGTVALKNGQVVLAGDVICKLYKGDNIKYITSPINEQVYSIPIPKGWTPNSLYYVPIPGYLDAYTRL